MAVDAGDMLTNVESNLKKKVDESIEECTAKIINAGANAAMQITPGAVQDNVNYAISDALSQCDCFIQDACNQIGYLLADVMQNIGGEMNELSPVMDSSISHNMAMPSIAIREQNDNMSGDDVRNNLVEFQQQQLNTVTNGLQKMYQPQGFMQMIQNKFTKRSDQWKGIAAAGAFAIGTGLLIYGAGTHRKSETERECERVRHEIRKYFDKRAQDVRTELLSEIKKQTEQNIEPVLLKNRQQVKALEEETNRCDKAQAQLKQILDDINKLIEEIQD